MNEYKLYYADRNAGCTLLCGQQAPRRTQVVFVIGPTNAGKSTFMDAAKEGGLGTVEVGRMMRAKYPPEHFQGQAAPKHTAVEAWSMMQDGIAGQLDKDYIFVDGQPRDQEQATKICNLYHDAWFMLLAASHDSRAARAMARDAHDRAKLRLTQQRLDTDYQGLYDVLLVLHQHKARLRIFDTEASGYSAQVLVSLFKTHFFKSSYPDNPQLGASRA